MKTFKIRLAIAGAALVLAMTLSAQGMMGGGPGYGNGMMGYGSDYPNGMMGGGPGYGYDMMGGGNGMMGYGYGPAVGNGLNIERLSFADVRNVVQKYLAVARDNTLVIDEIMSFDRNFYVLVKEKKTGQGAFELLVDPYTGRISPEPGPNMMWNVKYGRMGWQNGNFQAMNVDVAEARKVAQTYLDSIQPGFTVEEKPDVFYGYYTAHVMKQGKIAGMLSVNGYTGQVWFHSWHGVYQSMEK